MKIFSLIRGEVTVTSGGRDGGGGEESSSEDCAEEDEHYVTIDKSFSVDAESGYMLQPGTTIRHLPDGITEIIGPNEVLITKAQDSNAALVPTPGGIKRATHVFNIPDKSHVITEGQVIKVYSGDDLILTIINEDPQLPPPDVKGWIESQQSTPFITLNRFQRNGRFLCLQ